MHPSQEHEPFLDYSDERKVKDSRSHGRRTLYSQILVSTITSLLWVLVILFVLPGPSTNGNCTSMDSHKPGMNEATSGGRPSPPHQQHDHEHDDEAATLALTQTHYEPGERHNITTGATMIACGHSVAEARTLGCKYDILLNSWVPEPCYSSNDLMEDYKDDDSWTGFRDENLTQRLTVLEMSESPFYYTSMRDHINHCAMIWMKQFWVFFDQTPTMDTMISSPGHTDHCARYLLEAKYMKTEATKNVVQFLGCWVKK